MQKSEFLFELENCLKKVKKEEKEKFISYYDEMISDYMEDGTKEEEAVSRVGSPSKIAEEILADMDTITLPLFPTNKVLGLTVLVIGFPLWATLLLAVLLTIGAIYLTIWCLPFSTGVGTFAFFVVSIVGTIGTPVLMAGDFAVGLTQLGLSIASLGGAVLLAFATVSATKSISQLTKKITLTIYRLVRRTFKGEN
ncbi:DUF1700 domain-containing protein [Lachnospiraceae bacterium OttesenSCG-928-D06]|nr:DUF1700 domain-containing protein [Lachnospiraceae bacterium OttesenSCG-928-D06]